VDCVALTSLAKKSSSAASQGICPGLKGGGSRAESENELRKKRGRVVVFPHGKKSRGFESGGCKEKEKGEREESEKERPSSKKERSRPRTATQDRLEQHQERGKHPNPKTRINWKNERAK